MDGVGQIVADMKFVPNHCFLLKMSGRSSSRVTAPTVAFSISVASLGLGFFRLLMTRDSHVLLMPSTRVIATFVPRGWVEKYSINSISSPVVV
jgi:hypothetical protein